MASSQRPTRALMRAAWLAAIALPILGFLPFALSQSMAVLGPPATPTTTGVAPGAPPPAPDNNAQPLPPLPEPALGGQTFNFNFDLNGLASGGTFPSISIPANFLGMSIELSVADEFLGKEVKAPPIPLLNYLSAVKVRSGLGPLLRIGGNTQDTAIYNRSYDGILTKIGGGYTPTGTPITPNVEYSDNIVQIVGSVVRKIGANIVWGVNMATTDGTENNFQMVEDVRKEFGDHLQLLLVGNEPDRYPLIGRRPQTGWGIPEYINEWGDLTDKLISDTFPDAPKQFVAPSVCCYWTTKQVLDQGMRDRFLDRLKAISAIKYPASLCSPNPPNGHGIFLNQTNIVAFAQYDMDAVQDAVNAGVPYYLVESNTASCIGVPGVSNAFTASLWGLNAGLQLAFRNRTGVLWHSGGRSVLYNVVTPPGKASTTTAWITGPIFYSLIVSAEALRPKVDGATVQVVDLGLASTSAAAYGILENGQPSKVVAINMANDASGANNLVITVPQINNAPSVAVKFLAAPDVTEKDKITWAGQSFGYYSNGVLQGTEQVQTAACGQGTCTVTIPAPGAALIFLTTPTANEATVSTSTFAPTGTADPSVVLNSNGNRGQRGGATSSGSTKKNAAVANVRIGWPPLSVVGVAMAGVLAFIAL